jgi:hypothetical protein
LGITIPATRELTNFRNNYKAILSKFIISTSQKSDSRVFVMEYFGRNSDWQSMPNEWLPGSWGLIADVKLQHLKTVTEMVLRIYHEQQESEQSTQEGKSSHIH